MFFPIQGSVSFQEEGARLQNRSHTVDSAVLQGFSRDVCCLARKLAGLHIHDNPLEYNRDIRINVDKVYLPLPP